MLTNLYRSLREEQIIERPEPVIGSWVQAVSPDEQELETLATHYHLEIGHLKDALDPLEVPRLEIEGSVIYLFTRVPFREGASSTLPYLIIHSEEHLVTVSAKPIAFLQSWTEQSKNLYTTQKTKLILQILSHINHAYINQMNAISKQIRSIGAQLAGADIKNRDIVQLVSLENVLQDFISSLVPMNAILGQLLAGKHMKFFEEDKDLIEDLVHSTGQLIELARSSIKTIVSLREASSTIMTNNLNRIIKLLTSLTVILMIPNLVTGLYGMNVALPYADSPLAFVGIASLIVGMILFLFILFAKNRWL